MISRALLVVSALVCLVGCTHTRSVTSGPPLKAAAATAPPISDKPHFESKLAHTGPAKLYPDSTLTPGKADTLVEADLVARWKGSCPAGMKDCSYSESHRNVPEAVHSAVYEEYKVPEENRNFDDGEVDHLFPLCAGGSNDISNLWYQPAENAWNGKKLGYHQKDNLEAYICREIKNHTLDPKVAYKKITTDWVAYYLELGLDKKHQGQDADTD